MTTTEHPDGYRLTPAGGPRLRADIVDVYIFRRIAGNIPLSRDEGPVAPHGTGAARADDPFAHARGSPARSVEFLQLLRRGPPLDGTWHPIMGHAEPGETAVQAALRELHEEVGLQAIPRATPGFDAPGTGRRAAPDAALLGVWALEQVFPYYVAAIDCIVLSPRFAAEVRPGWTPRLNTEHAAFRWTRDPADFMWPSQKRAIDQILAEIVADGSPARSALRVETC